MYFRVNLVFIFIFLVQAYLADSQNKSEENNDSTQVKYKLENKEIADLFPYVRWFISLIIKTSNSTIDQIYNVVQREKTVDLEELKITLKNEIGLIVCVVIAVLLALLIPIIGFFFCCCRICGNCGGKKIQKISTAKNKKRRYFFVGSLTLLLILILLGAVSLFLASSRVKEVYVNVEDTMTDALSDVDVFVTETIKEVQNLKDNALLDPMDNIEKDLNNIDGFGRQILEKLNDGLLFNNTVGLARDILDDLLNATNKLENVKLMLKDLKENITGFTKNYEEFRKTLQEAKDECNKKHPVSECNDLTIGHLESITADWSISLDSVTNVNKEISDAIQKTEDTFDNFPSTLKSETADEVQKTVQQLHQFKDKIANSTVYLDEMTEMVQSHTRNATKSITENSFKEDFQMYNHYVYIGFVGLSGLVAAIWLFLGLGLLGGITFYQPHKLPTERSCSSNCSGILLIVGIVFIFLFSSILWLLTLPFFIAGSASQAYVCEPLYEEKTDFSTISEYLSKFTEEAPDKALSKFLFKNSSISLNIFSILNDCKNNQPVYSAFHLQQLIGIEKALNYTENTDLETVLDDLPNTIENVQMLNKEFKEKMEDAESALNIEIPDFEDDLIRFDLNENLTSLGSTIEKFRTELTVYEVLKTDIIELNDTSLKFIETKNVILELIQEMQQLNRTIQGRVPTLFEDIHQLDSRVQTDLKNFIKNFTLEKLNKIKDGVHIAVNMIQNDVGKCKPVWNLFDASRTLVCRNILDSINGFWFGLGWCLFLFLPSLIFGIKLAKYYRRMDHVSNDWSDSSDFHTEDAPMSLLKSPYSSHIYDDDNRYSYGSGFYEGNSFSTSSRVNMIDDDLGNPPMYRKEHYGPPPY